MRGLKVAHTPAAHEAGQPVYGGQGRLDPRTRGINPPYQGPAAEHHARLGARLPRHAESPKGPMVAQLSQMQEFLRQVACLIVRQWTLRWLVDAVSCSWIVLVTSAALWQPSRKSAKGIHGRPFTHWSTRCC